MHAYQYIHTPQLCAWELTGLALAAARFLALPLGGSDRSGCLLDGDRFVRRLRLAERALGGCDAEVLAAAAAACTRTPHKTRTHHQTSHIMITQARARTTARTHTQAHEDACVCVRVCA